MTSASNRIVECPRCGKADRHGARGLCFNCYEWSRKRGYLDRYPTLPVKGEYYRARVNPDDVDEAVVQRILGGEWRMRATPSEKAEVCRRWANSGRALRQLEALTGWATHRYFQLREAS